MSDKKFSYSVPKNAKVPQQVIRQVKPELQQISVRLPAELISMLDTIADNSEISRNKIIELSVKQLVQRALGNPVSWEVEPESYSDKAKRNLPKGAY